MGIQEDDVTMAESHNAPTQPRVRFAASTRVSPTESSTSSNMGKGDKSKAKSKDGAMRLLMSDQRKLDTGRKRHRWYCDARRVDRERIKS